MKSEKSQKKGQGKKGIEAGNVKKSTATREARARTEAENPPEREEAMRAAGCAMTEAEQRHQEVLRAEEKYCEAWDDKLKTVFWWKYDEAEKRFMLERCSLIDKLWTETELYHEIEERGLHKTARKKRKKSREDSDLLAQELQSIFDEKGQKGLESYLDRESQCISISTTRKYDVFLVQYKNDIFVRVEKRDKSKIHIEWNAREVDELKRRIGEFSDKGMIRESKDETSRFVMRAAQFTARAMDWYGMRMEEVFRAVDEEGERWRDGKVVFSEEDLKQIFRNDGKDQHDKYIEILEEKKHEIQKKKQASEELREELQKSDKHQEK